jgi:hypothetical protein
MNHELAPEIKSPVETYRQQWLDVIYGSPDLTTLNGEELDALLLLYADVAQDIFVKGKELVEYADSLEPVDGGEPLP